MKCTISLDRMADGHLAIWTNSWMKATSIAIRLRWRYGFRRAGKRITTVCEAIYPDFVLGNMRIRADWDRLVGYYFHAANEESDAFVAKFFGSHL